MRYLSASAIVAIAGLLGTIGEVKGQQVEDSGCLRLLGSVACPGFSFAYLSPGNLSNAFPFFESVTDVRSFDAAALNYFSNPFQWETTKFQNELGCSNATNAVLRYQRTVLCSNWVNSQWSRACTALYNGTSAATSQKMVCQSTCLSFAASENQVVNNTVGNFCPGPDLTNGTRAETLQKDYVDCTDWTTLATNNSESCISGEQNGEGNCGYGSSTIQLCAHCGGDEVDDCCYDSNTDISVCGFALAPRPSSSSSGSPSSTSSSPEGSGTLQPGNQGVGSTGLSGGQLAGIIVGSILGGLLLLGLLAFLILCLRKRRRANNRDSGSSFAAAGPHSQSPGGTPQTTDRGMFASIFPSSTSKTHPNSSEKGLLGRNHQGATSASTPTMGGDTLYSGMGRSTDAGFAPGASGSASGLGIGAAAGAGAGAGAMSLGGAALGGPGMRNSGIVLPRVRDENQSGERWIETGAEVHVLWPYQASLPDELDLRPGMKLRVLRLYDDAWGTAVIASGGSPSENGKQGAFPIVCVSEGSTLGSTPSQSASEES